MERKKNRKKVAASVSTALIITILFCSRYKIVYISGESMQPTLKSGCIVFMDKWAVPHRRDLVIAYSEELDCNIIKRVVAEGEATVAMDNGKLILNHEYVEEPYLSQNTWEETWGDIRVPEGQYFLLGDNREHSLDSRYFGCIERSKIRGKVIFSFF